MSVDVIKFSCSACHSELTVPASMAGVTGPCPICGQTVTSPAGLPPDTSIPLFTSQIPQPPSTYPPSQGEDGQGGPQWGSPPPAPVHQVPAATQPGAAVAPPLSAPAAMPSVNVVMPKPHSITQHLNPDARPGQSYPPSPGLFPAGGSPGVNEASFFPQPLLPGASKDLGSFPGTLPSAEGGVNLSEQAQAPQPAFEPPPWHQESRTQPEQGGLLGGLPPRRAEGEKPQQLVGGGDPSLTGWGSAPPVKNSLFGGSDAGPAPSAQLSQGTPVHSMLIPGAPVLQPASGSGQGAPGMPAPSGTSLLGRDLGATSQSPLPASEQGLPAPRARGTEPAGEGGAGVPASDRAPVRPFRRPRRSSNLAMFALSVILLVGFVAVAGWMFREPLMEMVHRYLPLNKGAEQDPVPTPEEILAKMKAESEALGADSKNAGDSAQESGLASSEKNAAPQASTGQVPGPADSAGQAAPDKPLAALPEFSTPPSMGESGGLLEVPPKGTVQNGSPAVSADAPAAGVTPSPASGKVKVEVSEEARPAADALLNFLKAETLEERLKYTLAAPVMKPYMQQYYAAQPSGPVAVDSIGLVRLDSNPQVGNGTHALFGVESRAWEYPVPVMLEETDKGFQVDWLSFVEFKDRLLERFFEGYQEGAARFHVGITRTHYFEDKVPNTANKDAFRVSPAPPNPFVTTVFVEKDSQLGRELKERIPWGAHVWAIAELEWVKLGSQQWVQLVGVPQLNWYSVPAEAQEQPEPARSKSKGGQDSKGAKSSPPPEILKALPAGR